MNEERRFTLEELAQFDGQDGRPAYTAANGIVYDASDSKLWRGGVHVRKHYAGKDLSSELLLAPHPHERLENLPRVGVLTDSGDTKADGGDELPGFARLLYNLHAHPASVHFPIAMLAIAALLHVLSYLFGSPLCDSQGALNLCRSASVYNLYFGVLLSPVPIVSGLVDWKYQFDASLTRLFVWKIGLTVLFLLMAAGALVTHLVLGAGLLYEILVLALAPTVLALGFVGGRITFPTV